MFQGETQWPARCPRTLGCQIPRKAGLVTVWSVVSLWEARRSSSKCMILQRSWLRIPRLLAGPTCRKLWRAQAQLSFEIDLVLVLHARRPTGVPHRIYLRTLQQGIRASPIRPAAAGKPTLCQRFSIPGTRRTPPLHHVGILHCRSMTPLMPRPCCVFSVPVRGLRSESHRYRRALKSS